MQNLALYDLETSPCTFDCIKFYLLAVGHYQKEKFELVIIPPSQQRLDKLLETYNNQANGKLEAEFIWQRMQNILLETSNLVPKISNVKVFDNRSAALQFLKSNKDSSKQFPQLNSQEIVPAFYSLDKLYHQISNKGVLCNLIASDCDKYAVENELKQNGWDGKQSIVSITLRRCRYQENRNSNEAAWLKFAEYLSDKNCFVVWVDDFEAEYKFLANTGYISHLATDKIVMRHALYELATLNYFVNSGNAALARFTHQANSISFKLIVEDYSATAAKFWLIHNILPPEQFLHLSPMHYQEWRDDSFENLLDNFEKHAKPLLSLPFAQKQTQIKLWQNEMANNRRHSCLAITTKIDSAKPVYLWGGAAEYPYWLQYCKKNNLQLVGIIDSYQSGGCWGTEQIKIYHPKQCSALMACNLLIVGHSGNGKKVIDSITCFIETYYPRVQCIIDGELLKGRELE